VDLVRRLYRMNAEPTLGGDPSDVTLMFTDIKEFTPIAEQLAPGDLALLLGEYFAALTAAIHENGGIVDKFIGDAVMALWNVPTPAPDHPHLACEAALECLRASRQLAKSPLLRNLPPLVTRIGLHRGPVLVGHFGAPDRMSYTVLGDGVNLAARLEGLNKQYGTHVIVSETVREAAAKGFRFRLLDRVVVKGKSHGIRIYELRGPAAEPDPAAEVIRRYVAALAAYWDRDFEAAVALLAGQEASDPPSRVLAARCRELAADPPPPEWDGVYVAHAK
jgi:adenylate cyclase